MEARKVILFRIYISFFVVCLFGLAIIFQIARIQFTQGKYWKEKAEKMMLKYFDIDAKRGNIYSADGSLLSLSVSIYDVHFDTRRTTISDELFTSKIDSISYGLAAIFGDKTPQEYREELFAARRAGDGYHLIHKSVTYPQLQQLKALPIFRLGRFKGGLRVDERSRRERPFRELAQRTIGTARDVRPVGIEAAFNEDLSGTNGKRLMQKIAGNTWKPVTDKDEIEPKDGSDIYTTIDLNIQDVAEASLKEHLRAQNADHGCAVLMEVQTGEIKAIANLSRNSDSDYVEDFNYAIAEATEPGSTFKLASFLAAIDDGYADTSDMVAVNGGEIFYSGHKMKDAHPPVTPRLSVQRIFETSSNVGTSKVIYNAYRSHPQDFIAKLRSFGLGEPLGLQIEGEGKPLIKSNKDKTWSNISLPWMSIGYESKLTPLQILSFYNAVANGGTMVRPKLVKEVRYQGQLVKSYPTEIICDSIASSIALSKVRGMMEGVVKSGSASCLKTSPYKVAGKTGTAQINKPKFGYDKSNISYQASFVGYFPADQPKYSCIVVVYAPSNKDYYGGAVAAPIFKDIADKVYSTHLDLHSLPMQKDTSLPDPLPLAKAGYTNDAVRVLRSLSIDHTMPASEASWSTASASKNYIALSPRFNKNGTVPNVMGMGAMDALFLLENSGLQVRVTGKGKVVSQSITPGAPIGRGQSINIQLD